MKRLFVPLFVIVTFFASAQSLTIKYEGNPLNNLDTIDVATQYSDIYNTYSGNTYLGYANNTSEPLYFKVKKEVLTPSDNIETSFCIGGTCYPGNISLEQFIDEDAEVTLDDEMNVFHATFSANQSGIGIYKVKYTFYNTDNVDDAVSVVIRYEVGVGVGVADVAAAAPVLRAYPNPATTTLNIEYDAANLNNPQLVICNLAGAVIFKTAVYQGHGNMALNGLNLNAGVYFYGLESDGKVVVSKKLLVK